MAKISEIKFNMSGTDYKVPINCTSKGEFNANLPTDVAKALRITPKLTAISLQKLVEEFNQRLQQYRAAETKEELFIIIAYQATGQYALRADGRALFEYTSDNKHGIRVSFSEILNAMGLDFEVAIKETVDKKEKWFHAKLGSEFPYFKEMEFSQPEKYHKLSEIFESRMSRYKVIPFSEQALQTLKIAQENMRAISEKLYTFISKDEADIELILTQQKLLN